MNRSLERIKVWRSLRKRRSLERWEQIRAAGKKRFVVRTGLTYGLTVVGATDFFNHVFVDATQPSISVVKLIVFVLFGFYIGSDAWSNREAEYQKALGEARATALQDSKTSP